MTPSEMTPAEKLYAVLAQLRSIFIQKSELKGYDDWDSFFGCINAIEDVARYLNQAEKEQEDQTTTEE